MLKDWYGRPRGVVEMLAHLPKPQRLSDVLEKLSGRMMPPETMKLFELRDRWADVAGPEIARRTRPSHIFAGTLHVEVSHPSWLREMASVHVKRALVTKVAAAIGADFCKDIRFVPKGGSAGNL